MLAALVTAMWLLGGLSTRVETQDVANLEIDSDTSVHLPVSTPTTEHSCERPRPQPGYLKLVTYTLNKRLCWTLKPPSRQPPKLTKEPRSTFEVYCPLNDGDYEEFDLGRQMTNDAYFDFKGNNHPPFIPRSLLRFEWRCSAADDGGTHCSWKAKHGTGTGMLRCARIPLQKLVNRIGQVLEFLYHLYPTQLTGNFAQKALAMLDMTALPRDICAAGRMWEIFLYRVLIGPPQTMLGDEDLLLPWGTELSVFRFPPELQERVQDKVAEFKERCDGSFDGVRVIPEDGNGQPFAFASEPAAWWTKVSTEIRDMDYFKKWNDVHRSQESLTVSWTGEFIQVKEWKNHPELMPYKHTSDTHKVSSVLVGTDPFDEVSKESCQDGPEAGLEPHNGSAFPSGCQLGTDVQQIVAALQEHGVPVCRIKRKSRARWLPGCSNGYRGGNEVWVRDFGFVFKGNDEHQIPILYERTDAFAYALRGYTHVNQADGGSAWIGPRDGRHRDNLIEDMQTWQFPPMQLEGGNLLATGDGVCLSTTELVYHLLSSMGEGVCEETQARDPSYFKKHRKNFNFEDCRIAAGQRPLDVEPIRIAVLERMQRLGCHTWVFTEFGREQTRHIDVFVGQLSDAKLGPAKFMVGWFDAQDDPFNSMLLEAARATLVRLGADFNFGVVDMPMPPQLTLPEKEFVDTVELERDMRHTRACWMLDADAEVSCTFKVGDCCDIRRYSRLPVGAEKMLQVTFRTPDDVTGNRVDTQFFIEAARQFGVDMDAWGWLDSKVVDGGGQEGIYYDTKDLHEEMGKFNFPVTVYRSYVHEDPHWLDVVARNREAFRWRSYTNYLPVHYGDQRFAIMPSFYNSDYSQTTFMQRIEDMENQAKMIIGAHFSHKLHLVFQDWRAEEGGSIHCMTKAVPPNIPGDVTVCA